MKPLLLLILSITIAMAIHAQNKPVSLNHIAIYVKDIERSCSFYKKILYLDTIPEPFKDGRHAWFKIGNNLSLHVVQGPKDEVTQYRSTHTCFSVGNIEAFIKHLQKEGVEYEDSKGNKSNITVRADGIKQIYFRDPDGYWIEINNDQGTH